MLFRSGGRIHIEGKGGYRRSVSFGPATVAALERWLLTREDFADDKQKAMFVSVSDFRNPGGAIQSPAIKARIRVILREAGVKNGKPRMFRVTFATSLYDDNVDLETIRQILGHRDINTTLRYISVSEKQLKTSMSRQRIDGVLKQGVRMPLWVQKKMGQTNREELAG